MWCPETSGTRCIGCRLPSARWSVGRCIGWRDVDVQRLGRGTATHTGPRPPDGRARAGASSRPVAGPAAAWSAGDRRRAHPPAGAVIFPARSRSAQISQPPPRRNRAGEATRAAERSANVPPEVVGEGRGLCAEPDYANNPHDRAPEAPGTLACSHHAYIPARPRTRAGGPCAEHASAPRSSTEASRQRRTHTFSAGSDLLPAHGVLNVLGHVT